MPTRPYKVSKLGGGSRRFTHLDKAVTFARTQARASWALEDWSVWDTSRPSADPTWDGGTCVRMVPADGPAYDPFARPLTVTLAPGEYSPLPDEAVEARLREAGYRP